MLYYDVEAESFYKERPDCWKYETFEPMMGLESGYLVVVQYTTYDSFGEDTEINYEIIDLYPTQAEAVEVAEWISNTAYNYYKKEKISPKKKADGSKIYEMWNNWGVSYSCCEVIKVEIQDKQEFKKKVFR